MPAELTLDDVGGAPVELSLDDVSNGPAIELTLDDVAAPEALGTQFQRVGQALARGMLRVQELPIVAEAASLPAGPSLRQERRAFERARNDPRYLADLAGASADRPAALRTEALRGPAAQLPASAEPRVQRQAVALDLAQLKERETALPQSQALRRFETDDDWFGAWLKDPVEITATLMLESLPGSLAGAAAGLPLGPLGVATGAGLSSFALEASGKFLASAAEQGVDVRDPEQFEQFLASPWKVARAKELAVQKGLPIAAFDYLSGGLAGKFVAPALRRGLGPVLRRGAAEVGLQGALGGLGETAGELAAGEELSGRDIFSEVIAEIGGLPGEAAGRLLKAARERARPGRDVEQPGIELDPNAPLAREVREPEFNEFGGVSQPAGGPESPPAGKVSVGLPATPSGPATDDIGTLKLPSEGPIPAETPVSATEAAPQPARPPTAPPADPEAARRRAMKRVSALRKIHRETEALGFDIIDWLIDHGGVVDRAAAKRQGRLARNRDLWDGQPEELAARHHRLIYNASGNAMMPDEAATDAHEAGLLASPDVNALWPAVAAASTARVAQQRQLDAEAAELTRQGAAEEKRSQAVSGLLFEVRNAPSAAAVEAILRRPEAQAVYAQAGEEEQGRLDAAARERMGEGVSGKVSERVSGQEGEAVELREGAPDRMKFLRTQALRESLTKTQRAELAALEAAESARKESERQQFESQRAIRLEREKLQERTDVALATMEDNPQLSLRAQEISRSPELVAALDLWLSEYRAKMNSLLEQAKILPDSSPDRDALMEAYRKALNELRWNETLRDMVRVHQEGRTPQIGSQGAASESERVSGQQGEALELREGPGKYPVRSAEAQLVAKAHEIAEPFLRDPTLAGTVIRGEHYDRATALDLVRQALRAAASEMRETATAGRLDTLAQRVHGRSYAELEEWQQDLIRQAVEAKPEIPRREQPGVPAERGRAAEREQPISRAVARRLADERRATGRTWDLSPDQLRPGDLIYAGATQVEVLRWEKAPGSKIAGWLWVQEPANPERWARIHIRDKRQTHYNASRPAETPISYPAAESMQRFADQLEALKAAPDDKLYAMGFGGVGRAVFNTALDLAAAALRAGATIADAVEKAIAHIRANHRGEWNEATARAELERELVRVAAGGAPKEPGQRERKLFPRLQAAQFLSPEVRAQITDRFYTVAGMKGSEAAASEIVDLVGPAAAAELALNPPADFPKAVSGFLASVVDKEAAYLERQATDPEVKRQWQEFQADFNNRLLAAATGAGQWINALKAFSHSSPGGVVLTALRLIDDGLERQLASYRQLLDLARAAVDRAHRAAIADTVATPGVQGHARGAVDAAIQADPEVQREVRAEAKQELAGPAIERARLLVGPRGNAGGVLEVILGHYAPGTEPRPLAEKLEAVGVPQEQARNFAAWLDRKFAELVAAKQAALAPKIQRARRERTAGSPPAESDSQLDRLIRAQLREWNVRLGEAVRKGQAGELRGRVGDALVAEAGLSGAAADQLRDSLNRRFDALAKARKEKMLADLLKPERPATQRRLKLAFEKLAELSNIGALDQPALLRAVGEQLGLKHGLTPEQAAELRRMAEEMQAVPADQQNKRQRLAQKIQTRIQEIGESRAGSLVDLLVSVWYADVLSGLSNLVNLSGNVMQAVASTSIMLGRNPRSAPIALRSLRGALGRALWDGVDVMVKGPLPKRTGLHVYGERRLERLRGWERVFTPLRYIGRALDAGDVIFHDPHEDMRFALLAALEGRKTGLKGEALVRHAREQLHTAPGELAAARGEAAREGYTGRAARQRAHEIVHQRRDERLTQKAQEYARDTVYRGEPYGPLGWLAGVANQANRRWRATIPSVPFPTLISNFFNEAFNYVPPVAAWRVWQAHPAQTHLFNFGRDGTLRGRELDWTDEADRQSYYDQRAKLLVGLAGASALWIAFHPEDGEDDDPSWGIYGRGPRDAGKRKTWLEGGGKLNSIKLAGTSYDYSYWPIAPLLAVLGNYFDTVRWHRDDTTAEDRLAYGVWTGAARSLLDTPVLAGLSRLLDVVEMGGEKGAADKLAKFFAVPAAGLIPARAALMVIDRINDPKRYDGPGLKGALLSQVPFARARAGGQQPVLNGLGEPVRVYVSERFAKEASPDPVWRELARLNVGLYPRTLAGPDASGESRDLTQQEIYEVVKRSGPKIRARIEVFMGSAKYGRLPDELRRRVIDAYVQAERDAAKARVLRPGAGGRE